MMSFILKIPEILAMSGEQDVRDHNPLLLYNPLYGLDFTLFLLIQNTGHFELHFTGESVVTE